MNPGASVRAGSRNSEIETHFVRVCFGVCCCNYRVLLEPQERVMLQALHIILGSVGFMGKLRGFNLFPELKAYMQAGG